MCIGEVRILYDWLLINWFLFFPPSQGVSGALTVLMKDAIKPTLMQTLEVRQLTSQGSSGEYLLEQGYQEYTPLLFLPLLYREPSSKVFSLSATNDAILSDTLTLFNGMKNIQNSGDVMRKKLFSHNIKMVNRHVSNSFEKTFCEFKSTQVLCPF